MRPSFSPRDADAVLLADGTRVPFRLRRHRQARRITLRMTGTSLTITAPARTPAGEIGAAVARRRDWIAAAVAEARALAPAPLGLGDWIPILDEAVVIVAGDGRGARRAGDRLAVPQGIPITAAVEAWYRRTAREHFAGIMDTWASRIGVAPARLTVRAQRSRWGSASPSGTISINWRLVLAPPEIGEYVMVHELVHLRHMDHSPAFWDCVETYWPTHRRERAWLRHHGPRLMAGPHALDAER
jgi:predicted metal-dependent hydrolase